MSSTTIEHQVEQDFPDFLRDESRRTGTADAIAFPASEGDIVDILSTSSQPVTIQGARTGITAGAVPDAGLILNMSHMASITGIRATSCPDTPFALSVQPGITLKDLRSSVSRKNFISNDWSDDCRKALSEFKEDSRTFFFPPDPTEDTASLGGMLACNASGARSYKYGSTRNYISALRVVTGEGRVFSLSRGTDTASGNSFTIHTSSGDIAGSIPSYTMPNVKNASGYYAKDDMDLVDLFVGAEGTLGIVTEIELLLRAAPEVNWAIMSFLPNTESAEKYVQACRRLSGDTIAAIEFFDEKSISLLRAQKRGNPAFGYLPEIKDEWHNCVFVELDGSDEDEVEATATALASLIEECDGSESATWMATESAEMDRMKKFRHALPEAVNLTIDTYRKKEPSLTKLGTDFAVPPEHFHTMLTTYKSDLANAGLDYVIFGHIGNDHVHVNILPQSKEQYDSGKELYMTWARAAVAFKGTVSAEHGIGKLKTAFLKEMYGKEGIAEMRKLKSVFDPSSRINLGNLFEITA